MYLLYFSPNEIIPTSLFAHGIHLNAVLEMCSGVHLRPQDNNINLGQEVAPEEGQDAEEYGKNMCGHDERASADEVDSEEAHPGDHVHHEAEGDTLGLVVVGWQVFAHVAEREAENAEQRYISKLEACTGGEHVTALQDNAVLIKVKVLRRLRRVNGHTDRRNKQHEDRHQENCKLWPVFFGPLVIGRRQLGCKFKNADHLEGAHSDAGQAHSEAEDE